MLFTLLLLLVGADIAKEDAAESNKEAILLNQDAKDAIELGNAKKIEAETKIKVILHKSH